MPSSQHRRTSSRGHRPSLSGSDATESAKSGNIRVVVRIRPPNAAELEKGSGSRPVVEMLDEKLLVFDPKEDTPPSYFHGRRMARRNFMQRKNKDVKFAFDQVFSERVTQQYVYENTTKAIVDSVLAGYNASVFAYGATGAGKTFTMLGAPDCPGVIFLTMVDLYRRIGEIAQDKLCDVAVSYLEVYNENIRDLLAPSGLLALREDPQQGVVVSGLTLHKPRSAEELLRMLEFGNSKRTQHPTDANAQSSRSHAVFQVFVRQKDRTANISTNFRIAKMSLIDLAGSERATVTTNRGARFREGANINRSLLALGNCINALADNKKSKGHIPYRNSKLTRLLKDSLGGNCQTVMIAAISPSSLTYEDTLNTLKYASRAKNIRTSLKQNVVNVDLHISRYTKIVEELRTEVSELKIKLQTYESGSVVMPMAPSCDNSDDRIHRLQAELHKVFAQRCSKRKELLELESSDRHLTILISRKQSMAERIQLVYGGSTQGDKTMGRFERHIAASVARQTRLRERKPAVEDRIKTNQEWLDRVKGQIEVEWGQDQIPMVLQESVRTRHLEVELKDCRRQIKHLKRFARQQDNHQQSSERLITTLLTTVRKQFYLLKGSGLATSDVMTDFEAIQKQVEGDREVAWADQSVSEVAEVKPTSGNGEIDLNYLLELPIMKCVESTPIAPLRSPRKSNGRLSSSCTPVRTPGTPLPGRRGTPVQVGTPAGRVPCPNPINGHPPSRVETPRPGTPYARRNAANCNTIETFEPISDGRRPDTPCAVNKICNIENGRLISDTPDNFRLESGIVAGGVIPQCSGVSQCIGQTVTKSQPSVTQAAEMDDARRDLAATFDMEGIQPLSSPAISETSIKPALKNATHVTSSSHHSEDDSSSANQDSQKTVARAILFNQENTTPNQKISPATGRIMSYADALATPQRLDSSGQQRAPFAVLTNNSPQLPNRQRNNNSQRLFNDAKDRCLSQSTSKTVKRNAHRRGTVTKPNPLLHRRTKSQGILGERPFSQQGANNHAETLRRFGLPSMSDQPISVGQKRPMPAYMSLTASAAHKRRNYNRGSQSSQENQPPATRLQRTESTIKPAVRIPSFSRSRSTSNLSSK